MSKNYQIIVEGYYRAYFSGLALFFGAIASFALIIFCVWYGLTYNLNPSQIPFGFLGIISGMVIIYFGLCFVVGVEKSREYTKNVVRIIDCLKPKEDGIVENLCRNNIVLFFFGLTLLVCVSCIAWILAIKYLS